MLLRTVATAFAATTLAAAFGPPRITVTPVSGTPPTRDAVLAITTQHHTEEEWADVSARAYRMRDGRRESREIAVTASATKGRYGVTRQWESGTAWVLVFTIKQGEHGAHGTASALVKVDAAGTIVGIENPSERSDRGYLLPRATTDADITRAFAALQH